MWTSLASWLERVIGWTCEAVLYVTTAAIFVILASNVILRYAVGSSLRWASELPELLFPWLVVSGIVLAVQHGGHIAVVMLTHRLPPLARRVVLAFGGGVVVALYAILAWSAAQLMPVVADELSPMLQVPGSVTVGAVEGGFILVAILTLISTVRIVADVAAPVRDAGEEAHP